MYGSFNEGANEVWDFVRCQRPDGTYYGTAGKCRSGKEVAAKLAKVPKEKLKKLAKHPGLSKEQKAQVQEAINKAPSTPAKKEEPKASEVNQKEKVKAAFDKMMKAPKGPEFEAAVKEYKAEKDKLNKEEGKPVQKPVAKKPGEKKEKNPEEDLKKAQAAYSKLAKKQGQLVGEDKLDEAQALQPKLDKAIAKMKKAEEAVKNAKAGDNQKAISDKEKEVKDLMKKAAGAKTPAQEDKAFAALKKAQEELDALQGGSDTLIKRAAGDVEARQRNYDARQDQVNLSSNQKKALMDYTEEMPKSGFGYKQLNECARTPQNCEDKKASAKMAKEMDAAIAKLPKNDDGDAFFRGIYLGNSGGPALDSLYKQLAQAKPGERFKDPAFGSYSSDPTTAVEFSSGSKNVRSILFINRSKQLTPINTFSAIRSENEALLPRNTEQTIRKVTQDGGRLIVELD